MAPWLVTFLREVWESLKEPLWTLVFLSIKHLWFWSAETEESAVVNNRAESFREHLWSIHRSCFPMGVKVVLHAGSQLRTYGIVSQMGLVVNAWRGHEEQLRLGTVRGKKRPLEGAASVAVEVKAWRGHAEKLRLGTMNRVQERSLKKCIPVTETDPRILEIPVSHDICHGQQQAWSRSEHVRQAMCAVTTHDGALNVLTEPRSLTLRYLLLAFTIDLCSVWP